MMTPRGRTFSLALKVHSAEVTCHGTSGVSFAHQGLFAR
jgi:hypothetical protein